MSEGGVVEREDFFLKRIGSIIRLLAAVMQTNINDKVYIVYNICVGVEWLFISNACTFIHI